MNPTLDTLRELAGVLVMLGAVVWGLWNARRRLRPWHVYFWAILGFMSTSVTAYMYAEARSGNYAGWGGLALTMVLLPAAFIAAISIVALITLAVLIPRYGYNTQSAAARRAERDAARRRRHDPAVMRATAIQRLKISAVMLVVVLLLIKLRFLGR